MKTHQYFAAALLVFSLAGMVACASTPKQEGTGEYLDDSLVTTKVKAVIFNDPKLKSAEINVETFKGVVQLSGFVSSATDVSKAIALAQSVKGVRSVRNMMQVK